MILSLPLQIIMYGTDFVLIWKLYDAFWKTEENHIQADS